jgi:hypothetical protein
MCLKFVTRLWTRFIRRRVGALAETFERDNETSGCTQCEKFLEQLRNS